MQPESEAEIVLAGERTRLVRLCRQYTGDVDSAEDLAQETLLKGWRHSHQVRDPDRHAQWLTAIARNECRRWSQKQRRERAGCLPLGWDDPSLSAALDALADDVDVGQEIERADLAHALDRALAHLPPTARTLLIDHCINETPHAEIAARLEMSVGAVKVAAKRAEPLGAVVQKRAPAASALTDSVLRTLLREARPIRCPPPAVLRAWQDRCSVPQRAAHTAPRQPTPDHHAATRGAIRSGASWRTSFTAVLTG